MCKSESSQRHGTRDQSADSSKACSKTTAFNNLSGDANWETHKVVRLTENNFLLKQALRSDSAMLTPHSQGFARWCMHLYYFSYLTKIQYIILFLDFPKIWFETGKFGLKSDWLLAQFVEKRHVCEMLTSRIVPHLFDCKPHEMLSRITVSRPWL